MRAIHNLLDLLIHQVQNLYAAETQMQKVMPSIIEKAQHGSLKNALQHHLQLTEDQKNRLQEALQILNEKSQHGNTAEIDKDGESKGMAGLLEELQQVINENVAPEVTDATIITYVQKIEHYEISTYGTAHAFARQMDLHKVEGLLNETLNEEYDADDLLTALATAALNKEAIPEGLERDEKEIADEDETASRPAKVSISERTINSPGGRAGTSHRRYGNGESRGH